VRPSAWPRRWWSGRGRSLTSDRVASGQYPSVALPRPYLVPASRRPFSRKELFISVDRCRLAT